MSYDASAGAQIASRADAVH